MNDAHYHMLINHFPIIGLFFGIGILIFGILKKNHLILNIAYTIFIVCMITGQLSMMTGDKAEHFVENISGFSEDLIEEHEESAEGFMKIMYFLGLSSIVGLYATFKKHTKSFLFPYIALIVAFVAVLFAKSVGTSGGEIRHVEIREGNSVLKNTYKIQNNESDE